MNDELSSISLQPQIETEGTVDLEGSHSASDSSYNKHSELACQHIYYRVSSSGYVAVTLFGFPSMLMLLLPTRNVGKVGRAGKPLVDETAFMHNSGRLNPFPAL